MSLRACVLTWKDDFIAFYSPQFTLFGLFFPFFWLLVIMRKIQLQTYCSNPLPEHSRLQTTQDDYELTQLSSNAAASGSKIIWTDDPLPTINQVALSFVTPYCNYAVFGLLTYLTLAVSWLIVCFAT